MVAVSIVIPTRNRQVLLRAALKSVFAQSFKNFEVIISDNSDNLDSKNMMHKYFHDEKRIHYHKTPHAMAMIENWNYGLQFAKGKHIAVLMDDDYWHKDFLKECVQALEDNPSVGLAVVQVQPVANDKKDSGYPKNYYRLAESSQVFSGLNCIKTYLKDKWLVGLPSALVVKAEVFHELGLFNRDGLDQEMWLRACQKYDVYYINKKYCYWRTDTFQSYTSTLKVKESIMGRLRTVEKVIGYTYESLHIYKEIKSIAEARYKQLRLELCGIVKEGKSTLEEYLLFGSKLDYVKDRVKIELRRLVR